MKSLVRVELHRALARRSVRIVAGAALLGLLIGAVAAFFVSHRPADPASLLSDARAERAHAVEACVAGEFGPLKGEDGTGPGIGAPEEARRSFCDARMVEPVENFVRDPRVHLAAARGMIEGFSTLVVMIAIALGASFIGAEWSHRTMTTTLTWEPRRARVLAAKLGAFAIVALGGAVVFQILLALTVVPAAVFRGTTEGVDAAWARDVATMIGRIGLMAAVGAVLGQAVTMITRNTAATLGALFVYLAVLERMVAGLRPKWAPWLLAENAGVFVTGGNVDIAPGRSLLEATVILAAYLALMYAASLGAFRRQEVA